VRRTRRIVLGLLVAIATLFAANETPKRPRLVLAIVIDQFRYDYLLRFRNEYTSGLSGCSSKARFSTTLI